MAIRSQARPHHADIYALPFFLCSQAPAHTMQHFVDVGRHQKQRQYQHIVKIFCPDRSPVRQNPKQDQNQRDRKRCHKHHNICFCHRKHFRRFPVSFSHKLRLLLFVVVDEHLLRFARFSFLRHDPPPFSRNTAPPQRDPRRAFFISQKNNSL